MARGKSILLVSEWVLTKDLAPFKSCRGSDLESHLILRYIPSPGSRRRSLFQPIIQHKGFPVFSYIK
jgi:hypothetical protein